MAWWPGLSCMDACITEQALSARADLERIVLQRPQDTYHWILKLAFSLFSSRALSSLLLPT